MNYRIVEGSENMDLGQIAGLLKTTYWANKRPMEQIEKSVRNSACYGVYVEGADRLAGFARVISDFATAYYLCDVVVDAGYRGMGLGKALVSHIVSRPEYAGLRGILLTRDAHGLYAKFGFEPAEGRAMTRSPEGS